MIIVVTMIDEEIKTGSNKLIASHGIDRDTGSKIILSPQHPKDLGAVWNESMSEWVIYS